MSRIDSRYRKISSGRHFQNGHHNTAQIQYCPISTTFHMWVDYDFPNLFPTLKNFLAVTIFKMAAKFKHCPISSKFDMWVDNDVSNCFPTLKNFYRSPFSKWPPQYRTNSTLSDFIDISYLGRLWCLEFIPDIEKFQAVTIFKMATKFKHCPISSKFDMWVDNDVPNWLTTLKNFYRSPFSKWPPHYRKN
jgi:uncharacterized protein Usg